MDRIFGKPAEAPRPDGSFGYAVVGLGHIAEYFLEALKDSPLCHVAAVVSGDAAKAQRTAAKYSVPSALTYAEFDSLRDNPAVHGVYIALPVSMHREFTERAAAAGKHVLCEKPMASTAAEARAMIAACRGAGVQLSVAYRCPHTFVHQRARDLLRGGALGQRATLRIESGFGFPLKPGWRTDREFAGGGSLFDVGIYPLNAARYLLGEDPTGVAEAKAACDDKGLEEAISWTSVFPSGATLAGTSSYRELIPDTLRITGSQGTLLLAPAFSHRESLRLQGTFRDAQGQAVSIEESTPKHTPSQFRLEAEQLVRSATLGDVPLTPGEDGLADLEAMELIYRAAGVAPAGG